MDEDFYTDAMALFAKLESLGVDMKNADAKSVVGAVFEFWKTTIDRFEKKLMDRLG